MKFALLIFKNLRRNRVRSTLTGLAVVCLVVIFSMIVTVLRFLQMVVTAKAADVPVVITERYRFPSLFDRRFIDQIVYPGTGLNDELKAAAHFDSGKYNLWYFNAFTLDPERKDKDLEFLVIATLPDKIVSMIDGLEDLDPRLCELMQKPPVTRRDNVGILVGPERLAKLKKRVGDVFKAISLTHREAVSGQRLPIEMEFEVVGELPATNRWAQGAFMDFAYLDRVLKEKKNERDGRVNLGWLKLDTQDDAARASGLIEGRITDIKCEVASTAVGRFLDGYKDLFNGIKFVLIPAIMVVMVVIVANAISITVRERTKEMAVLKVLGFRPGQILVLVLGEAMLLGLVGGLLGAAVIYTLINHVAGGIKIPVAFFDVFFVPAQVFWWGPTLGAVTALLGGIVPAWAARSVKVSDVFAKVA